MRVVILGVTGASGRAVATEFADAGWEVVGAARERRWFPQALTDRGVRFVGADRHDPQAIRGLLDAGADLVVDCLCYSAQHARELIDHRQGLGQIVMLSSKAVYVDDRGNHSNSAVSPDFGGPVSERQRVLEPDFSGDYRSRLGYGTNKVAAELTLLESGLPVSVLRPSLIHGPGARQPREWFVLRRLLDGRARLPLAHRGETINHPTAAANLARLVMTCALAPAQRILNIADPDAPTAAEIVSAIADAYGATLEVAGLDHDAPADLGRSPWAIWPAFTLDTSAASALGYAPVGTYAELVASTVAYLRGLSSDERDGLGLERTQDYELDEAGLRYADQRPESFSS